MTECNVRNSIFCRCIKCVAMAEKLAVIDSAAKIADHLPKTWCNLDNVIRSTHQQQGPRLIAVTAETAHLSSAFPLRRVLRGRARR